MKFLLCLISVTLLFSCQQKKQTEKQGSTFLYYPKANIYYDIEQKQYYVFDSSVNQWQKEKQLTLNENDLGKKVLLTNAPVPVYRDNAQHRLIYGAALYTSSDEVRRKYIEDSLNSLPPPVVANAEKKEKKKGFFKRLWDKVFH